MGYDAGNYDVINLNWSAAALPIHTFTVRASQATALGARWVLTHACMFVTGGAFASQSLQIDNSVFEIVRWTNTIGGAVDSYNWSGWFEIDNEVRTIRLLSASTTAGVTMGLNTQWRRYTV